ncbi:putative lytic transglycosylase [Pseudomonas phage PIP]|nr:putative lytic transglycosylase [Pseudomonas phage PIP]
MPLSGLKRILLAASAFMVFPSRFASGSAFWRYGLRIQDRTGPPSTPRTWTSGSPYTCHGRTGAPEHKDGILLDIIQLVHSAHDYQLRGTGAQMLRSAGYGLDGSSRTAACCIAHAGIGGLA